MPLIYENRQHMHAAMKEHKRAKLLEEIDALCTRARDTAQEAGPTATDRKQRRGEGQKSDRTHCLACEAGARILSNYGTLGRFGPGKKSVILRLPATRFSGILGYNVATGAGVIQRW